MGENVSAVIQRKLPPKLKDQGMFAINCTLGQVGIQKAMCDLGASINVIPSYIYKKISANHDMPLKETRTVLQLADCSVVYPKGILEDVLVKVNDFLFPADFYVLDMCDAERKGSTDLLLGRPFFSTTKIKF